jgi:hypothetical protein
MDSQTSTMHRSRMTVNARARQHTHMHVQASGHGCKSLSHNNYHNTYTSGAGASRGVRLTIRGRVLLLGMALVMTILALGVFGALRAEAASQNPSPAPAGWQIVVIQPHDTLWQIARQATPEADPRPLIEEIKSVNSLSSSSVRAGARLWLPPAQS